MEKRRSNAVKIVLVIIYMLLSVSGLVLMKYGGNTGTISLKEGTLNFGMSLISMLGFICYIASFLLYTRIVVMFDLSYITPICTGIIQVLILLASYAVFKEEISKTGIIGAIIVIFGIIIMNYKKG